MLINTAIPSAVEAFIAGDANALAHFTMESINADKDRQYEFALTFSTSDQTCQDLLHVPIIGPPPGPGPLGLPESIVEDAAALQVHDETG